LIFLQGPVILKLRRCIAVSYRIVSYRIVSYRYRAFKLKTQTVDHFAQTEY